jgi:hypothetical protein
MTRQIIGLVPGEAHPGYVAVLIEMKDHYAYAKVSRGSKVVKQRGSRFSKNDFYGSDPRRFMEILGKFDEYSQTLNDFIAIDAQWTITEGDTTNLFKWDAEARRTP